MNDKMPDSLKRKRARSTSERESAVLDNFKLCRDLMDGAFTGPGTEVDLVALDESARTLGLHIDQGEDGTIRVLRNDTLAMAVAIVYEFDGRLMLAPTEEKSDARR